METNSKGKRMVFEEDIKYLQELKGENISSKTVGRVVDTEDITILSDDVCNALKCGDMVNKVDSTGKHSYRVSYKKNEVGMCLTYSDASCVETVSYNYTAGHWVYNSKDVTNIENMNKMAKIKDKSGHLRFIEGECTPIEIPGVSFTYNKWSLSGTHLMIVIAGTIDNGTTIANTNIASISDLPEWIINKINPLFSLVVDRKEFSLYNSAWGSQTTAIALIKGTGVLNIYQTGSLTTTDSRNFRYQFDLLIDNE